MPIQENQAMVMMSAPDTVSQACKVLPVSANGSPEENPSSSTAAMRGLRRNLQIRRRHGPDSTRVTWGLLALSA